MGDYSTLDWIETYPGCVWVDTFAFYAVRKTAADPDGRALEDKAFTAANTYPTGCARNLGQYDSVEAAKQACEDHSRFVNEQFIRAARARMT